MNMHIENLPINIRVSEIIKMVKENSVTIITAETGSGKSTVVPRALFEAGYRNIVVTQPRAVAAVSLANFVAETMGEKVGEHVGYKTRFQKAPCIGEGITYLTDGTALIEFSKYIENGSVIVIDEVHEFGVNTETLLALAKKALDEGENIKVVIMSATLEAEKLSEFFDDAPCISVSGKTYPVECRYHVGNLNTMNAEIVNLYTEGKNILAFYPGKQEIEEAYEALAEYFEDSEKKPTILRLHAEMSFAEQQKAFEEYANQKIVLATNVAQTSITISDIDAVVDSGLAKQTMLKDGVEGLYLVDVSYADCMQRMGRAGRTKPGVYVLVSSTNLMSRPSFAIPEIQRSSLEGVVLRLMEFGINPEELEFLHQPDREEIKSAKRLLTLLGAIENDALTETGKTMAGIPLSVRNARIFIEAKKYGVEADIAIILAILEVNGIKSKDCTFYGSKKCREKSDLLYELELFKANYKLYTSHDENGKRIKLEQVKFKAFQNALRIAMDICKKFQLSNSFLTEEYDADSIRKCIIVGFPDRLYKNMGWIGFYNGQGSGRKLDKNSECNSYAEYLIANPLDIQFKDRYGITNEINIITMCTKVRLDEVMELIPQVFERKEQVDRYGKEVHTYFNGALLETKYICSLGELRVEEPENFKTQLIYRDGAVYTCNYYKQQLISETFEMTFEDFYYEASQEQWDELMNDEKFEIKFIKFRGKFSERIYYEGEFLIEDKIAKSEEEFKEKYPEAEYEVVK